MLKRLHDRIDAWLHPPVVPIRPRTWADWWHDQVKWAARGTVYQVLKFLLWMFSCVVLAAPLSAAQPACAVPLRDVRIHDGDTVHVGYIDLPFGLSIRDRSIRAAGYDAPEINHVRQTVTVTLEEIERGKEAKAALERLMARGTLYAEDTGKHDPYGRASAWLWVLTTDGEWIDVAAWMIRNKYTRSE